MSLVGETEEGENPPSISTGRNKKVARAPDKLVLKIGINKQKEKEGKL